MFATAHDSKVLLVMAAALGGCGGAPPDTSQAESAITQGRTDDNTIEANVVVQIGGQNCTGTLISPLAVLTAKHCVTGDDSGKAGIPLPVSVEIGNGAGAYATTRTAVAATPYHDFEPLHLGGFTDGEQGIDVALLWLDAPVLAEAHILRPALAAPPVGGSDTNGGTYGHDLGYLGFAGWSAFDGATRQVILFDSVTLHHYPEAPDDIGQIWDYNPGPGDVNPGDSGGPMFLQHVDGTRDVLGVLSGHAYTSVTDCGFSNCVVWADVTRGEPARWIREQMVDATPRGPRWLAMHPGYLWRGEVDYTGPCQRGRDQDCDHWFDEHDNCPAVQNYDQADADDDGLGDACTVPTVRFVSPSSAPPSGGVRVQIDGTNFDTRGGTRIAFGGAAASGVTCPSSTQCFATAPPGNGMVDIVVWRPQVSSLPGPNARFAYVPSVTGIEPATARVGDAVTIHGVGLSSAPGATAIRFGSSAVTNLSCYPGPDCTAIVPPGSGTVDVQATVNGTLSAVTAADRFSYPATRIDHLDVASGSITGGTYVVLSGSGFDPVVGGTRVYFGAVPSDYVTCDSSTSCRARSPAAAQYGTVHIAFSAFGATSPASAADQFTYVPNAVAAVSWSALAGGLLGLNGYAPAGGHTVALTSSDPAAVVVPAALQIAAGSTATTFALAFLPIDRAETVTITASDGVATASTTVAAAAWPVVTLELSAATLAANASATATVSLASAAPAGGATVALSSTDPAAIAVPASVTVPAGSHTTTFSFTNAYAGAPKSVALGARYAGTTSTATIQVPGDFVCKPLTCKPGWWFNPDTCGCERGQPN